MLSDQNLETLLAEEFGFIVAHSLQRGKEARSEIEALRLKISFEGQDEEFVEEVRSGVRFVMAYSPEDRSRNQGEPPRASGQGRRQDPGNTCSKIRQ
jgi:hypothetical protein